MVENEEGTRWFRLAELDLKVAIHLHKNMYPTPNEPICFNCQQAAEKYLKGFLVFNEIEPPGTHNLPVLQEMCEEICEDFSKLYNRCVFLNKFVALPCHPNELEITAEDVHTVLCYAKDIKDFVEGVCDIR
jgi:HEPN domain-containing protein